MSERTDIVSKDADLTIDELEELSGEIYTILTHGKGLTMPDYIKRAKEIPLFELGYRKCCAVKHEPKLDAYFPDEILSVLRNRIKKQTQLRFNKDDEAFIQKNIERGSVWLAKKMYTTYRAVLKHSRGIGVEIPTRAHKYTKAEDRFILANLKMNDKWIADKLNLSQGSIENRIRYLKNPVRYDKHIYTPKDILFIENNYLKGYRYLSNKLNVSLSAARCKIRDFKIKLQCKHLRPKR